MSFLVNDKAGVQFFDRPGRREATGRSPINWSWTDVKSILRMSQGGNRRRERSRWTWQNRRAYWL